MTWNSKMKNQPKNWEITHDNVHAMKIYPSRVFIGLYKIIFLMSVVIMGHKNYIVVCRIHIGKKVNWIHFYVYVLSFFGAKRLCVCVFGNKTKDKRKELLLDGKLGIWFSLLCMQEGDTRKVMAGLFIETNLLQAI